MPTPQMLGRSFDIIEGFPAVDLQTAPNTGDWVAVGGSESVLVLFISGVGTAGDDPTLTIQQAKDNSGGSVKALNIVTSPVQIWKKQAATDLSAVTKWADASGDVATNTWTHSNAAEQSVMVAVEFLGQDLDFANDFGFLRATVADVGANAQPGCLLYLPSNLTYGASPDSLPSKL